MKEIKITSGKYRGRSIRAPGGSTHPMGAREKLALFNMLAEWLPGATVLDAYAGSGALGIEALSRGAGHVVLVEKSPRVAKIIRQNIAALGLNDTAEVHERDVKTFAPAEKYDIILADPPYDTYEVAGVANLAKYLKPGGVLVLSHPGDAPELPGLQLIKTRAYAAAHLSLYR